MNAFEMMTNTFAKQLTERLPDLINGAMKNLPPDVLANIGQIREIVSAYKAQLDRLENNQRLIMKALNISTEDGDHGRPEFTQQLRAGDQRSTDRDNGAGDQHRTDTDASATPAPAASART